MTRAVNCTEDSDSVKELCASLLDEGTDVRCFPPCITKSPAEFLCASFNNCAYSCLV
jgi:hypothetical protein